MRKPCVSCKSEVSTRLTCVTCSRCTVSCCICSNPAFIWPERNTDEIDIWSPATPPKSVEENNEQKTQIGFAQSIQIR
jgi:hypothetical protein